MASQDVSRAVALSCRHRVDAWQIVWSHLGAQRCAERFCAVGSEVIVEVATSQVQCQHSDANVLRPLRQALAVAPSSWISIAGDVEALETW